MLKTGQEHLASLRDGRRVYSGGELVEDVTGHPAFRNAAASFAMLYDRKAAPENRGVMTFEEDGSVPGRSALDRMKLYKLAWDLLGSEFAGRHLQYEKFYAGPNFVVTSYSYLNAPWDDFDGLVDNILDGYDVPKDMNIKKLADS